MNDNIHNEIAEIAPTLASLEKSNPFKVPKDYFSFLENRTFDALGKESIIAEVPPEGYFDGLSDQIIERVSKEEKGKIVPLFKRTWLSVAASLIVISGTIYFMNNPSAPVDAQSEFAFDFEPQEALDYLVNNDELYLSDLLSLDLEELDLGDEASSFENLEDTDLDYILNELDQDELEDLL